MKITTKILGSYMILAVMVLLLGAGAFLGIRRMNSNAEQLYEDRLQPTLLLAEISQLMENTRVHMLTGVINSDATRGEPALENVERIDELLVAYNDRVMGEEEAELVGQLNRSWENYSEIIVETSEALAEGDYMDSLIGIRQGGSWYGAANMYLNDLLDMKEELSQAAHQENQAIYMRLVTLILAASLLATVFAGIVGLAMGKMIGQPLSRVSEKLNQVASGKLTGQVLKTKRKDEIGLLEQATSKMQEELKYIISSVSQATHQVLSASEELMQSTTEVVQGSDQIALTMQELTSGAESQAMHTNDLSASMSTFVETIEQSVKDSAGVHSDSSKVRLLTGEGKAMMDSSVTQMQRIDQLFQQSVSGMQGLDAKSREVSSLVTVIEEIAEQTNLLALNAAIEAARAGEQGKGFAVVAEEVRKLAEQVSGSVGEITSIVKGMQAESHTVSTALKDGYSEVQKGTTQIHQTGQTFETIASSVEKMEKTIQIISQKLESNKEQTVQMNANVEEIASVSQQSAAGIQQTSASAQQANSTMQEVSASSEELSRLAEELNQIVEKFEL